jgi:two-component system, chemotaxis family, chemotaxis protein CheY
VPLAARSCPFCGEKLRSKKPLGFPELGRKTCLRVDDFDVVRKVARIVSRAASSTSAKPTGRSPPARQRERFCSIGTCRRWPASNFSRACAARPTPFVIYCATKKNSRDIVLALSSGANQDVLKPFERESVAGKLAAAGLL